MILVVVLFVSSVVDPFVLQLEVLPMAPVVMSLVVQDLVVLLTASELMFPCPFVVRHHIS